MNISANGIIGKLETHAELIGAGIGIGTWGYDQLLDSISQAAVGHIHMPALDAGFIESFFVGPKNKGVVMTSVGLYLAGEVFNMPALKKGAKGLIEGNAIQHVLYWITHASEGCDKPGFVRPLNGGSSSASLGNRGYGGN